MSETFDDAASRRTIRESLDTSLVVEAAAGTGKTSELVLRLVAVLAREKTTVDRIVAVTFTRKAAGELKLRLRQGLEEARARDTDERPAIERAIAHLEEARIGTIHAFAAELLRERPVEARVDPRFAELTEGEAERVFAEAFRRGFQGILADMPEGIRRALLRTGSAFDGRSPTERLRDAAWKLIEWRDFSAPWRREPFDRAARTASIVADVEALASIGRRSTRSWDDLARSLEPLHALLRARERSTDLDALEALILGLESELKRQKVKKRGPPSFAPGFSRDDVLNAREALLRRLEAYRQAADADLAPLLQSELAVFREHYAELKRRAGKLDFVDLLIHTRDLVRDSLEVRRYFQERFTHIFIDEFQDTDPLQAELMMLLAADDPAVTDWERARPAAGKLFLVGDPKQSIYRFRRADVALYQAVKAQLAESGAEIVHLSRSFRASRPIQAAVNAAFGAALVEDAATGQPGYVPLEGGKLPREGQPSLIALPVPRPYGHMRVAKGEIAKCLPDTVGAFIEWLVKESGWTIRDPEGGAPGDERAVPIAPRHVCVLFRRYVSYGRDLTRDFTQALEARSVPHILVGGRAFHHREEVETLRAALAAIEWPDDELSVFATLKGSLFAIGDDVLFRFKHGAGRLSPYGRFAEDLPPDLAPVRDALTALRELNEKRNRRPIVETLSALLATTRAHAAFALRPDGPQALANVQRVLDHARGFEIGGGLSFRAFVEHLDREAEAERRIEAPLLEEGAEGVRIMTVHAAKGLEFPVVILGDLTTNLAAKEADRYVDPKAGLFATRLFGATPRELADHAEEELARDRAEGLRVAYVAATRARDVLVVPAVGVEPQDGWFAALNPAIYPPAERWRHSTSAPGCPAFGESSVLQDSPEYAGPPHSVRPGLHPSATADYDVVWWDPGVLSRRADADFKLKREFALGVDEGGEAARAGLARSQAWKRRREDEVQAGRRPSLAPFAPTEPAAPAPPEAILTNAASGGSGGLAGAAPFSRAHARARPATLSPEIAHLMLEREADRPRGTRFGTLVHTILRDVAFDAGEDGIRALAEIHGRALDATEAEVRAAVSPVARTLAHDLMTRARRASRLHRELPILFRTEEGRLLDGTVDLTFLEDGVWFIVDFKTDADPSFRMAQYERQMRWYLAALSKIMSAPSRGVLLAV